MTDGTPTLMICLAIIAIFLLAIPWKIWHDNKEREKCQEELFKENDGEVTPKSHKKPVSDKVKFGKKHDVKWHDCIYKYEIDGELIYFENILEGILNKIEEMDDRLKELEREEKD